MAGNMESILLGGSDDSSDDSDNETLQEVTTAVPAAAAVAATVQVKKAPAPAPAQAATGATGANLSQSELSNRLKNLYSPASKTQQQQKQQAPAPAPAASRPVQQTQAPTQPQQSQRRNAMVQPPQAKPPQQQQQQRQSSQSSSSDFRPLMPNARGAAPAQSPAQQAKRPSASSAAPADPFEPTPLKTMIQRQQQKAAAQQQAAAVRSPGGAATTTQGTSATTTQRTSASSTASQASSTTSTVAASNTSERARQERDSKHRKDKERFLMFTRVLIKYLEQKDPSMHLKAKAVIKECAEKNKRKEPGYESVTASMQKRLRAMVGDSYWARAEAYLDHFLKQKEKLDQKKKGSSSSSSSQQPSSSSQPRTSQPKTKDQVAKERQLASQKLEEIKREKEKVKQRAEMQRRKDEEERRMAELKKEQQKKEAMARMAARNAAEQAQAQAAAQAKKKSNHKRKGSGSTASGLAAAVAARASLMPPGETRVDKQPAREYSELMQTLDHAVDYDWTSAALLLGKEARADVSLTNEQKRLLYGGSMAPPRQAVEAANTALSATGIPTYVQGWGKRNVLSARGSWARVRLREQRNQLARGAKQPPVVGGLRLPSDPKETPDPSVVTPEAQWFNEERAEQDKTLALMSEATQMYLKSVLEKSLVAARQRENLDGIRLWHLQHGPSKPPMSLRLGCDVNRQVAQAEGNAAKTVQRMEEALERQTRVPAKARALDNDETLYNATSMADLALRPKLANAAEEADANAKRSFEVSGGKEVTEAPPFGRVPKRPKITKQDFTLARELADYGHQRKGIAAPLML